MRKYDIGATIIETEVSRIKRGSEFNFNNCEIEIIIKNHHTNEVWYGVINKAVEVSIKKVLDDSTFKLVDISNKITEYDHCEWIKEELITKVEYDPIYKIEKQIREEIGI